MLTSLATNAHGSPLSQPVQARAEGWVQQSIPSENGSFLVQASAKTKFRIGPNAFDLVLRDRSGKGVEGATLAVTPWMPTMGHGVWEKPVVDERKKGGYHVGNVLLIMAGDWELRISIKKGAVEDRAVISFKIDDAAAVGQEPAKPREGYDRSLVSYQVPEVTLIDQDGRRVKLKALIDAGKPVILDFIFTTCTTVCPILSAGFTNLRRELGEKADQVQLISVSIDPEHDRPDVLRRYSERFKGGPGWELLTGDREEVGKVMKAFNAFSDKMSHEPLYLLHAPGAAQWVRIKGLITKSDLLREYRALEKR